MNRTHYVLPLAAALAVLVAFSATQSLAVSVYTTSFEAAEGFSTTFDPDGVGLFYDPGSVHTQPTPGNPNISWNENSNGGVQGEIVVTPILPPIPVGLGVQSLYLVDRSDKPSPMFGASSPNQSPIVDAAGETGTFTQGANATTPGAHARTTDTIQAEFWFKAGAADLVNLPDPTRTFLNLNLGTRDTGGAGPSRRYADAHLAQSINPGKFTLKIQELAGTDPNAFVLTGPGADLNRDQWYRMVLQAVLVDGLAGDGTSNDIVTFSAYDTLGNLQAQITGDSFEVSYKYASAGVLRPATDEWFKGIAINSFGYRLSSSVGPSDELGYLDGLTLTSGVIPEPSSFMLAAVGLVGCGIGAIRRRGKS